MRIESLFDRNIFRTINGVVKADQLDETSIWQELDEFVITHELDGHFRKFFSTYLDAINRPDDADIKGRIGVWVSGFFGSGKSHFIKVLSYLLENREHYHDGATRKSIEFFRSKVKDKMFFADMEKSVSASSDVILFNIDSKADSRAGRDAILHVFLKVLNERQGYSPDHPHIAHMERYLDGQAKLQSFHQAYHRITKRNWIDERDAYEFNRDFVLEALAEVLGQSAESCEKWIDHAEENFAVTVEKLAGWTKEFLDSRGPTHKIIFLVDEIGQFIGGDTHLMLNLQTIVEELGTICAGRAWVIVTSQEDIDAVLGEVKTPRNDFSKIQGRFASRLSLSSANVDEVIQERLLAKVPSATTELFDLFASKGDIIKNQLTFKNLGTTFRPIKDQDDFARNYPFVPYQFKLLQKVFESIRKVGATGLHLAQGERSLLDAFQTAAKQIANDEIGVLVPLYRFYPAIDSFLDTTVKRTIEHAKDNPSLEPFDNELLKVLFLIRYVEEMKGNIDNLVTLCVDRIDIDRLALRRQIEESLLRLEKETLISRSGDLYQFLTNEERDVNREIKSIELNSSEEAKLLGDLIFEDVLKGQRKHRFSLNKQDFVFNRLCDLHPAGNRTEGVQTVSAITPLNADYELYTDSRCILESAGEGGQVLIRLRNEQTLGRELRTLLQTDKYVRTKDDGTLQHSTKKIIADIARENHLRRERLMRLLEDLLTQSDYFVAGTRVVPKKVTAQSILDEAFDYLIRNTFTKMGHLAHLNENPLKEIQAILRSNDIAQQNLDIVLPESNPEAIKEVREYVDLCTRTSKQIVLHELINNRYGQRPYGWPDLEVALLLSRLVVLGEIHLHSGGDIVPKEKLYDALTTQSLWRKTQVIQRKTADPASIQKARAIAKDVFSQSAPDGEDPLTVHIRGCLGKWQIDLHQWKALADTQNYPGLQEIHEGIGIAKNLLACEDSRKLIERFNEQEGDIREFADSFNDLRHFYDHQKPAWEKLRAAVTRFSLNKLELDRDEAAAPALRRMQEILKAPHPYSLIQEADSLILKVAQVNDTLVAHRRHAAQAKVQQVIQQLSTEAEIHKADASLKQAVIAPLEKLKAQVEQQESIAHLAQTEMEADRLFEAGMEPLEAALQTPAPPIGVKEEAPKTPAVKPRCVVQPSTLATKPYLETTDDVTAFVEALKKTMVAAIARGERIQIK